MDNPFRDFFYRAFIKIKRKPITIPSPPPVPINENGRFWINVNCKTSVLAIESTLTVKTITAIEKLNPKGLRKQGGTVGCEFNILTGKFTGSPQVHFISDFVKVFKSGQKQAVMVNIFGVYKPAPDFTIEQLKNYLLSLISGGGNFDFLELGNEAYLPGQDGEIDAIYPSTLEADGFSIGARLYAENCVEVIAYLRSFAQFKDMKFGVIACFPVAGKPKTIGWNKKVCDIINEDVQCSANVVYTIHKYTGAGSPNVVNFPKWGNQAIKAARSVNAALLQVDGKFWVTECSYINDPGSGDNVYLQNYPQHTAFDLLFLLHLHLNPDVEEVFKHSFDGREDFELVNVNGDLTYSGKAFEILNKIRGKVIANSDYSFSFDNGFIIIDAQTLEVNTNLF